MFHERTKDAAKGKWRGVLLELGVPSSALRNKHGPCPMCGGEDRFRWDNKRGDGTWICNQCGAGDGMALAMGVTGKDFASTAAEIDRILGDKKIETDAPGRPSISESQRLAMLRAVAAQTAPVRPGDLVDAYLRTRRLDEPVVYPKALRFSKALRDGEGGVRPAMVATVHGPDGANFTLHKTFLRPDGLGKADMEEPRKFMSGELLEGVSIRLREWSSGPLGIAEGIETALAAGHRFEMPCWAAMNAGMLAQWIPPAGCDDVAIFADHDRNFTGQAAAFRLANRLALKGVNVTVHVPPIPGEDWADVWKEGR